MLASPQGICLCMIVKDEASVIARCIASVRPFISHWIIVDTGSTDGTQDIIWKELGSLPGMLHERPWRDFAHNRSEALALARPHAAYSLVIDADDVLEIPNDFEVPELSADAYLLKIRDDPLLYWRKQLVSNRLRWVYRGVLHEYIDTADPHTTATLSIGMRRLHDGARRKDPSVFERDVEILEHALRDEGDPFLRSRYTFYLAQSYRDSCQPENAINHYMERAKLGFWAEEIYVSLYQAARLMETLGYPDNVVLSTYEAATDTLPQRVEARHGASRLCRTRGMHDRGYDYAKGGLDRRIPDDALFAEPWIYEYGLRDEFAVNAYWAGHHSEAIEAGLALLEEGCIPAHEHSRVLSNIKAAWSSITPNLKTPNLGPNGRESFCDQHAGWLRPQLRTRLQSSPRVFIAILARQKEAMLPLYLDCIDALAYPKSSIVLYIRTNNNTDRTTEILQGWLDRNGGKYASVEFDATDVSEAAQDIGTHDWNPLRFRVLARLRNSSIERALELGCDYYFTCDVCNFIRPETLRNLISLSLPIVAPFLRSINPARYYSNFHADIDAQGYYADCDQYSWIVNRWTRGVFEVPVVNGAYLVRADMLPYLSYEDGTERHEYVIFSESARTGRIPQYIDNRIVYGYVTPSEDDYHRMQREVVRARALIDLPT